MKKESKFRGKVATNAHKQKTADSSYGYLNLQKGLNVFKPDPGGRTCLDIIPYVVTDERHPDRDEEAGIAMSGDLWYRRPFKIHRNVGVSKETVVCPTTFGKKCPICEYRNVLVNRKADKEETKALKPSSRNLYCVIPIGQKGLEEEIMIWDVSQFLFQDLLNDELEENRDNEVFPDLEQGLSLKIRFDSKTMGSGDPFAQASRIDFVDRKEQYTEEILDSVPNLDEILQLLSYKEIEAKFQELEGEEVSEDEVEEERPKKIIKREREEEPKKTTRRREPEPEEEEEKPRRKIAKEEEEEEEEEKPTRKNSKLKYSEEDGDIPCPACDGTGMDARGRECPVCEGSGIKPERKRKVVEEEEEEAPKKLPKKVVEEPKRKLKPSSNDVECPKGFVFGEDFDTRKVCDTCSLYDDCEEANVSMSKK
jgi:hypothetical protein